MGLVDDYLSYEQAKKRSSGLLYVTETVKDCLRNAYFSITDPQVFSLDTLRIFETGKMIEDWYIKVLRSTTGINVILTQSPCYYKTNEIEIHGRLDALCQHNNGSLVIHEIKSIKSTIDLTEPRKEHEKQIQFYMNTLNVDFGMIDYIDKEILINGKNRLGLGSTDKTFTVNKDPSIFANTVQRAKQLKKCVETNIPPPREFCWRCDEFCAWKNKCNET